MRPLDISMKYRISHLPDLVYPIVCTALSGAVFFCPVRAHEAVGGEVRIVSTIDSGGLVQTGGNVQITGFIGEPGVVATGGNVVARQGGNSMIYYATEFAVASAALTINESGAPDEDSTRTALRGSVVYDDATFGAVDGSLVAWTAPSPDSALASISAEGIAQASTVYENTVASFTGSYGGLTASNSLTVLNALPDNFREWAGDTFDDAWQIAVGMPDAVDPDALNAGIPYWQLYAMGRNPLAPISTPLTGVQISLDGYLTITWTRNPYATNYIFRVQETTNLTNAFATLVNPVSVTNSSTPQVESITTRASAPMTNFSRQFLRVSVEEP
jgi:hypothetical protein